MLNMTDPPPLHPPTLFLVNASKAVGLTNGQGWTEDEGREASGFHEPGGVQQEGVAESARQLRGSIVRGLSKLNMCVYVSYVSIMIYNSIYRTNSLRIVDNFVVLASCRL